MNRRKDHGIAAGNPSERLRREAVVAAVPGRLRLRDPILGSRAGGETIAGRLRALNGVRSIEARPAANSLVLFFDPARVGVSAMVDAVLDAAPELGAEAVPAGEPPAPPSSPAASARRRSRRWNRLSKIGMLASLPASLALAAVGAKRLHIVTGSLFTVLLLVHLLVHRRHLIQ